MSGGISINHIAPLNTNSKFQKAYKKLDPQLKEKVKTAINGLLDDPIKAKYRFEKLKGYCNPNIYTIHITGNHSHKLSFEVQGNTATLRNIATHKEIDRTP